MYNEVKDCRQKDAKNQLKLRKLDELRHKAQTQLQREKFISKSPVQLLGMKGQSMQVEIKKAEIERK